MRLTPKQLRDQMLRGHISLAQAVTAGKVIGMSHDDAVSYFRDGDIPTVGKVRHEIPLHVDTGKGLNPTGSTAVKGQSKGEFRMARKGSKSQSHLQSYRPNRHSVLVHNKSLNGH